MRRKQLRDCDRKIAKVRCAFLVRTEKMKFYIDTIKKYQYTDIDSKRVILLLCL